MRQDEVCERLQDFAEAEGQLLTLLVFMIFGGLFVPDCLNQLTWPMAAYAAAALVLVRPLAVRIALLFDRLSGRTVLFLGWFGPRGIASLLFVLLMLETDPIPGRETIRATVMLTVLISIVAHGLTAQPAAERYGRHADDLAETAHEKRPVRPLRPRIRPRSG
jgi:NhaP-type Na+/H+ or K+/H+ antiporter